jgi:hypothetical protein
MGRIRVGLIGTMGLVFVLQSGCSFLFVNGPPADHAGLVTFECSGSRAWPTFDLIWAALNGIGAASAAEDEANPDRGQIITVGLVWLAVSGVSAAYGFSKVSECEKAKRARDERYGRGLAAPAPASPRAPAIAPAPRRDAAPGGVTPAAVDAPARDAEQAVPAASPASGSPVPAAAPASGAPAPPGPSRSLAMRPPAMRDASAIRPRPGDGAAMRR